MLADQATPVVADRLFSQALAGGARATGRNVAGLVAGQRADFVVLDRDAPNIGDRPHGLLLSALVFCEHGGNPVRDVFVGGQQVIDNGQHALQEQARAGYRATLADLLNETA